MLPLPWLASIAGWIVAEMGRQPWVIYGYMPTERAAELPSLDQGVFATLFVVVVYLLLGMLFAALTLRIIRIGPRPLPSPSIEPVSEAAG
jgi:cytochrome d ubiquinol oxidase subunit I